MFLPPAAPDGFPTNQRLGSWCPASLRHISDALQCEDSKIADTHSLCSTCYRLLITNALVDGLSLQSFDLLRLHFGVLLLLGSI